MNETSNRKITKAGTFILHNHQHKCKEIELTTGINNELIDPQQFKHKTKINPFCKIISKHITAPIKENPIEIQQTPT